MKPASCAAVATVLGGAVLAGGIPAFATGGFGCEVDDRNLRLSASAGMGRGMGAPFLNFTGEAELRVKEAPDDMRKLDLGKSLIHHWTADRELRLHFYYERTGDKPFVSAELILRTVDVGEDVDYAGTYRLDLFTSEPPYGAESGKAFSFEGKATCMVE
jgi:hypothetical protein